MYELTYECLCTGFELLKRNRGWVMASISEPEIFVKPILPDPPENKSREPKIFVEPILPDPPLENKYLLHKFLRVAQIFFNHPFLTSPPPKKKPKYGTISYFRTGWS